MKLLILAATLAATATAAEPRTSVPIGKEWLLSAGKLDKTKMDGKRTLLLTATGKPVLKHALNPIKGPADIIASADKIECDFPGKKFILTGSLRIVGKIEGGGTQEITSELATRAEITFSPPVVRVEWPYKVKMTPAKKPAPEK